MTNNNVVRTNMGTESASKILRRLFHGGNLEIFGLSGKFGSGKDFVAKNVLYPLLPKKRTLFLAFADQLKIDGIVKDGLDREKVFGTKDEHTRKVLQLRGTEQGRHVFGDDIWVRYVQEWMLIHTQRGIERFIIPDARFMNELKFIKDSGGWVLRIYAPNRHERALKLVSGGNESIMNTLRTHASETNVDNYNDWDVIVDNDTPGVAEQDVYNFLLGQVYAKNTKLQQEVEVNSKTNNVAV